MQGLRLFVVFIMTCGFGFAQEHAVLVSEPSLKITYEIDWDVDPDVCESKLYEWADGKLKCVGRVVQDSGIPLLEPGLRGAIMEAQRDYHLAGQNMYRLQAVAYLTQPWIDFKNAEMMTKIQSQKMGALQDVARDICERGNTEYSGPMVGCVKTETAQGLMAKALTGNKDKE